MKFNFKKIASVLTGAVMLTSTVALAAAANFPAPFVKSGAGDYAVVYGSAAVTGTDNVAAADINAFLTGKVTTTTPVEPVTNSTPTDGDYVMIEKSKDRFNLGDRLNGFQSSLDSEDLPVILADGTYENANNDEFEYEQKITLGNQQLAWNQDNKFNAKKPFVGFLYTSGQSVMNYTLDFTDNAESNQAWGADSDLKNTVIKMLGRDYYISSISNSSGGTITLLDTANSVRIAEGETQTITVGDKSYQIKVVSVSKGATAADDAVTLEVNGVELSNELNKGDTSKIKGENTYVGVKSITASNREVSAQSAVVTIGTGQLVLANGAEVELNGKALSEYDQYDNFRLNSYITRSLDDLSSITLEWKANNKVAVIPGTSITMPGFDALKLSIGNFVSAEPEETSFSDDSDSLSVSTEVQDGPVEFSVFYHNNDTSIAGLGKSSEEKLITKFASGAISTGTNANVNLYVEEETMFAATWISGKDAETYVYKLTSVTGADNKTILENQAGGKKIELTKTGEDDDNDRMNFELVQGVRDENATVKITTTSGGTIYLDRVATKAGLVFILPSHVDYSTNGNRTSFDMIFSEQNDDSDDIQAGENITANFGPSADGAEPKSISGTSLTTHPKESNSDIDEGYVTSDRATFVSFDDVDDGAATLSVQYTTDEKYAQVYVTESKVTFGEGSSGGSAGWLPVKDTEVSSVSSKNLIVVGGSCVNTVAAKLLGSDTPLCDAAWMTATNNVGAGSFLIQTFANPWSSTKVATLVAGYDASDTTNAANALKTETIDTTVGKKYVKLAGQTLQLV